MIEILIFGIFRYDAEAGTHRISVLISYPGHPVNEVFESFQRSLRNKGVSAHYDLYSLEGNHEKIGQILQKIKISRPHLIFTIGSITTEETLKEIVDIPIVAGMILRPNLLKASSNGTGVFLEYPVETQFKWLRQILPDIRSIGVIYNPSENQAMIENAIRIASKMGFRLKVNEVRAPQNLPYALNNLVREVEVLWGVPDDLILNQHTAKHILLFSFRNSIPFIGLSSTWVKAGALYALEADYIDIGVQCGEMALSLLNGVRSNSISPEPPRKVTYSLNLRTAKQMKIKLSEKIIREASQIF